MRKESLNTINFSLMAYVVIRLGHGISAAIEQFQNHKKITGPLFQGVLSGFSHVQFFVTLRTVACQAPFSMGFSRKEYQSGLPCPPPGDLPNPGIELVSPVVPALQAEPLGETMVAHTYIF